MTTCTPLKPFRCWQYRKDSGEAVPGWAKNTFRLARLAGQIGDVGVEPWSDLQG
jgi:hypothetical protein